MEIQIEIRRVECPTPDILEAINGLLPQLSPSATPLTDTDFTALLNNEHTHLFVAEIEGRVVGTLSLVVVDIPTGRKAWIEDVVVDESARGCHIGEALVERAKSEAKKLGAKRIYLTSNPSRKAARALYAKCGFEEYDTTLFRTDSITKQ